MKQGKLIIISGFSGVGKGTIIANLMKRHPGEYGFSVSATTRAPRPGEVDGREYYFVSREEFLKMIEEGQLLEHAEYSGNFYGTPAGPIDKMLAEGKNIILDIEVNGMHQVRAMRPDVLSIFVIPPSTKELIKRLTGRGTETEEQIYSRLNRAAQEGSFAGEYSCIINNTDVEESTDAFEEYIESETQDTKLRNKNLRLSQKVCKGLNNIKQGDIKL